MTHLRNNQKHSWNQSSGFLALYPGCFGWTCYSPNFLRINPCLQELPTHSSCGLTLGVKDHLHFAPEGARGRHSWGSSHISAGLAAGTSRALTRK